MNNSMVNMPKITLSTVFPSFSLPIRKQDAQMLRRDLGHAVRDLTFVFVLMTVAFGGLNNDVQAQQATSPFGYRFKAGQRITMTKSMSMRLRGHEQNVNIEEVFSIGVDSVNANGELYLTIKGNSDSKNPDSEVLRAATGTLNGPTALADGSVAHICLNRDGNMVQGRFGFPPSLVQKVTGLNPREKRLDSLQRALVRAKEQRLLQALAQDLFLVVPMEMRNVEGSSWVIMPRACESLESFVRDTSATAGILDSSRATKYTVAQTTYYGKDACYLVTGRPRDPLARNSVMEEGCMMVQHDDLSMRKSDGLVLYREVTLSGFSAGAGPFTSTVRYTVRL